MLFGLDYRYYSNNVGTQFWRATSLDAFNPVYGSVRLIAPTLSTYVDSSDDAGRPLRARRACL